MTSLVVLLAVFVLIAVRRVGRLRLQIWQVMLLGAVAVLVTGQISPRDALRAIDLDVILFLFGMFVVGQALEDSGLLAHLSGRLFRRVQSGGGIVLVVLFAVGLASAFLMNDTTAIIGTPVVMLLSRRNRVSPKLLLLALAFAVTTGSVMSPIGNPQNLLIAIRGHVESPFLTFLRFLLLPTLINLAVAYVVLRLFYPGEFRRAAANHPAEPITDRRLALLSWVSLCLLVLLIAAKIAVVSLRLKFDFRLTYIALASALPILLLSPRRFAIARRIDWSTLVFFAAMFVLTDSAWRSGIIQGVIGRLQIDIRSVPAVLLVSVVLSQFISNVPLVALYLPMLMQDVVSTPAMMALAAGSTVAGNLFILGAASNVIIIQNAEKKAGETLTFWEFARVGVPLTVVNVLVYWLFSLF